MQIVEHEQLQEALLDGLEDRLQTLDMSREEIDGSFDLFGSGLLDSMGFVDLLTLMEERLRVNFDFEELDFDKVETVDALVAQLVALQLGEEG